MLDEIKDLVFGILINNFGISYPYPMCFHELSDDSVDKLMEMNIGSTAWTKRMFINGMNERERGSIINIKCSRCECIASSSTTYSS